MNSLLTFSTAEMNRLSVVLYRVFVTVVFGNIEAAELQFFISCMSNLKTAASWVQ
jgi:hypothetical protein